jgi:hypothetical protein
MAEDVAAIYARMEIAWNVKGWAALGVKLQRPAGTIASRKYQGRVPTEYILRTMLGTGCREEWLMSGEGPMLRGDVLLCDVALPLQEVVMRLQGKGDAVYAAIVRAARLLEAAQPSVIRYLVNRLMAAEEMLSAAEDLNDEVPGDS